MKRSRDIRIRGIVQGVGFRPFIYQLARRYALTGFVRNDTEGVFIRAEGSESDLAGFVSDITRLAPPLAYIESVSAAESHGDTHVSFEISGSAVTPGRTALIPPDSAVCARCLEEFNTPSDRRYHYPFITCIHCGPRFSIVNDIPYDRQNTSMDAFPMCPACAGEYTDPENRRFHTQPNACPVCGPHVSLFGKDRTLVSTGSDRVAQETVSLLKRGAIIAIKGVGGYLLACDALNDSAVMELRRRKNRPFKPFALMAGSIASAGRFLHISAAERELLLSKERPIVLLKERAALVSPHVASSLTYHGMMLPYAPFQHLLFEIDPDLVLVMSSGNIADEPIIFRDDDAFSMLGGIADYFVTYNREIAAFTDDSLLFIENNTPFFIRRSRGYVPVPFKAKRTARPILATGGDLKNCFALARDESVILSQYLGDLSSASGNDLYRATMEHYEQVYAFRPEIVVSDMHPGYFTSFYADELEEKGLRSMKVQHHHAHIASVLEDRGVEGPVIGIAYDGTGFGTDGTLWGSEFLVADRKSFLRKAHFTPFPLPGGESAIKDVWKTGVSLLHGVYGRGFPLMERGPLSEMVCEIIEKGVNSPLTCSIGRLFDGVSAMLGLSHTVSAEAEAAQLLEEAAASASSAPDDGWTIPVIEGDEIFIDTACLVEHIAGLAAAGHPAGDTALFFHRAIARATVQVAGMLRDITGISTVALSGGSFQNRLLLRFIMDGLTKKQFDILTPRKIPFNDGCMAIGQLAISKELINDV